MLRALVVLMVVCMAVIGVAGSQQHRALPDRERAVAIWLHSYLSESCENEDGSIDPPFDQEPTRTQAAFRDDARRLLAHLDSIAR